jgi:hypothetical protein
MQQLIEQLTTQYGITEEQATGIIDTVQNYQVTTNASAAISGKTDLEKTDIEQPQAEENLLKKATHFVEDHAGGVKEKAEELLGGVGNKIKGLFH